MERGRRHLHRLLNETIKELASRGRVAAIEAEGELVQVVLEVIVGDAP